MAAADSPAPRHVAVTAGGAGIGRAIASAFAAGGARVHVCDADGAAVAGASTAGQYGLGMRAPYVAAKWGVIGLTKTLAIELGAHDVRVNAICPGSVYGDRMRGVIDREAAGRGLSVDQVEREYVGGQSIARWVQPTEIADLCVFLASDAARMISGQAIAVDGHTETWHLA